MTELDINIDDLFADLFDDRGEAVALPPAEEAETVEAEYVPLVMVWEAKERR